MEYSNIRVCGSIRRHFGRPYIKTAVKNSYGKISKKRVPLFEPTTFVLRNKQLSKQLSKQHTILTYAFVMSHLNKDDMWMYQDGTRANTMVLREYDTFLIGE